MFWRSPACLGESGLTPLQKIVSHRDPAEAEATDAEALELCLPVSRLLPMRHTIGKAPSGREVVSPPKAPNVGQWKKKAKHGDGSHRRSTNQSNEEDPKGCDGEREDSIPVERILIWPDLVNHAAILSHPPPQAVRGEDADMAA
jgi:hypothetical protein